MSARRPNRFTRCVGWCVQLTGFDDRFHHGIAFFKLIVGGLTYALCRYIIGHDLTWIVVAAMFILIAASWGRAEFGKVIDLVRLWIAAKWPAAHPPSAPES